MRYLKKVGLLAVWLVLSLGLLVLLERFANMHTPGVFLAAWAAKATSPGSLAMSLWFGVWVGVDFVLCFAGVYGLYVIFVRFLRHVEKLSEVRA